MSSTQTRNTPLRSWDDSLARVTGNTIPLWFPRILESCRYRHEIWYWMGCNSQAMWSGKKNVTGRLWQGRYIAYNFVGWWKIWGTLGNPLSFLWIFFILTESVGGSSFSQWDVGQGWVWPWVLQMCVLTCSWSLTWLPDLVPIPRLCRKLWFVSPPLS